jgi:hypothetical protein
MGRHPVLTAAGAAGFLAGPAITGLGAHQITAAARIRDPAYPRQPAQGWILYLSGLAADWVGIRTLETGLRDTDPSGSLMGLLMVAGGGAANVLAWGDFWMEASRGEERIGKGLVLGPTLRIDSGRPLPGLALTDRF